ncbi:MAG: pyridine nucleotide-disulfide oxidoreductase [Gammaproteobacteria bacterium]|nr:pyridine nucleotide-disulfide oxidoreductase [Gammaproteobacteria bacterium]
MSAVIKPLPLRPQTDNLAPAQPIPVLPPKAAPVVAPPGEHRDPNRSGLRQHVAELFYSTGDRLGTLFFFLVMTAVIVAGYRLRLDRFITPEYGSGYLLGIAGGSLMLLLLIYPLRKRYPRLAWLGSARGWFQAHMMMGVVGPACILYHCNYQLGALNSNIALICMLVVAGSGLFGRYFYTRIHYGLYGTQITRVQLKQDMELTRSRLKELFLFESALADCLHAFEKNAVPPDGETARLVHALTMGLRTHWVYGKAVPLLRRAVFAEGESLDWDPKHTRRRYADALRVLTVHLDLVRKLSQISFFERLFSLWHILHVPLFVMMVITAVAHIIAVHVF